MIELLNCRAALWCGLLGLASTLTGGAAAAAGEAPPIVIDDFSQGAVTIPVAAVGGSGNVTQVGDDAHIVGGVRCASLDVTGNPFGRPSSLDIGEGRLVVDTGVHSHHAITLLYGWDEACAPAGLGLDLSGHEGLRFDVAGMDLGTAGAVVIWSSEGSSSTPLSIAAGEGPTDVAFADFQGDADLADVQFIAVVIQSGGFVSGHDYAIRSIKAVGPL